MHHPIALQPQRRPEPSIEAGLGPSIPLDILPQTNWDSSPYDPYNPLEIRPHVNQETHHDVLHEPHEPCIQCPSAITAFWSGVWFRATHHAHIAIAKAMVMPFVSVVCMVLGQLLQRGGASSKGEYVAPLGLSSLGAFIGGQCLVGCAILLIIILDIAPSHGTRWHRGFTVAFIFIACVSSVGASPLGLLIINIKRRPNEEILDPFHAASASGLGATVILFCLLLAKLILYRESHRSCDCT